MGEEQAAQLIAGLERAGKLPPPPPPVLSSFDVDGIAQHITNGAKNIIVCAGAGISVSAGIPDFRTPGMGLYDNLQRFDLPDPQSIFALDYFQETPAAFYTLAKELFPGSFCPTPSHYFLKLLADKGLLTRCYTQNIDSMEAQAGLDPELCVAAHGNFDSAHCLATGKSVNTAEVKAAILAGEKGWRVLAEKHGGLVKPDIVFFGENLPERFFRLIQKDFKQCDLLIVMGTSLMVRPFSSLIHEVGDEVPRLLINREEVGCEPKAVRRIRQLLRKRDFPAGFDFDEDTRWRDVSMLGDCDDGVAALAAAMGWGAELEKLVADGRANFESVVLGTAAESRGASKLTSTWKLVETAKAAEVEAAAAADELAGQAAGLKLHADSRSADAGSDAECESAEEEAGGAKPGSPTAEPQPSAAAAAPASPSGSAPRTHVSGFWVGSEEGGEPIHWALSLSTEGALAAFGCGYSLSPDGSVTTYQTLRSEIGLPLEERRAIAAGAATVRFQRQAHGADAADAADEVECVLWLSDAVNELREKQPELKGAISGETVDAAHLVNFQPELRGSIRLAGGGTARPFSCKLSAPAAAASQLSGLWIGEAAPIEALEREVPRNPIRWALATAAAGAEPADARPGAPRIFGAGYFDDAADVPGMPVLTYTLQGGGAGGDFYKLYDIPGAPRVHYSEVQAAESYGQPTLSGQWANMQEGTQGLFACRREE